MDVYISQDLQKDIKKAVDMNCKNLNSECFAKVGDVIKGPDTRLKSWQTEIIMIEALGGFLGLLFLFFYDRDRTVPAPIHMKPDVIKTASELATATEIVAIPPSDGPTVMITASPGPTSVTGYVSVCLYSVLFSFFLSFFLSFSFFEKKYSWNRQTLLTECPPQCRNTSCHLTHV